MCIVPGYLSIPITNITIFKIIIIYLTNLSLSISDAMSNNIQTKFEKRVEDFF